MEIFMTFNKCTVVAALILASGATATLPAAAQDTGARTVEQYTCKDVMRDSGSARDTAIAFLHGFLLGKSGSNEFNLETLTKQTDAFIDQCLDNPAEKAMDAMMNVKS
jgi:hypothetical protein